MLMKNILILGGTGFLGSILYNKFKTQYIIYRFGQIEYNAEHIQDNKQLLKYININNIDTVIDFTRNTKKHFMSFFMLIKKLPLTCTYVHISTYNLIDPNISNNEEEYLKIKLKIEKSIRYNIDYTIRVPWILKDPAKADISDICKKYFYTCSPNSFADQLFNILCNKKPGLYYLNAIKYIFQK